jgi:integrase
MKWLNNLMGLLVKKTTPVNAEFTFLKVLNQFIDAEHAQNDFTPETKEKHGYLVANIYAFFAANGYTNLLIKDVKISHMEEFKLYLHKKLKSCGKNHAVRHLQLCKRVMKYAVKHEIITHNTIEALETKRDKTKPVVSLELKELKKFLNANFNVEIYTKVVDLYVYQCLTGLSYEGLYNHTIVVYNDSEKKSTLWVTGERRKNSNPYYVPLADEALLILNKYNQHLPKIENSTYNRVLREVSHALGIKKYLTTHTARKTFATIKRQMGWSTESIADMLGHSTIKTTETYYLKNGRETILNEFNRIGIAGFSA